MKIISKQTEIEQHISELNQMVNNYWQNNFVLTGEWWFLLILSIVPWLLWWKIVDKKRLLEILLFGCFIIIFATFLDVVGWNWSGWYYPKTLFALCTPLFPIDYTLLPIIYMLVYQFFFKWKTFILATILMAAVFSFILEPVAVWINFYKPLGWKHIYSFLIYILIGILLKWLIEKIIGFQKTFS